MARIEVLSGDFVKCEKSRFGWNCFILHQGALEKPSEIRLGVRQLTKLSVHDVMLRRVFGGARDWVKGLNAASMPTLAGAALTEFAPRVLPYQSAMVSWLNGMIGAAAATAAINSPRQIAFTAHFEGSLRLKARTEERALLQRLPMLYSAAAANAD